MFASKSRMEANLNETFDFSKYDFIGFDLDNTLCTYKLNKLLTNHFHYMTKYLNDRRGYNIETEMTPATVDFMSRGLIIDIAKGNLLKVTIEGEIVRASHGMSALSQEEIVRQYGPEKKWIVLESIILSNLKDWKSKNDDVYSFMDYTDVAATAVYALAIASENPPRKVWEDVIESLKAMYSDEDWMNDIFTNSHLYINKTSDKVLKWLKALRKISTVGLITSNWTNVVPRIAAMSLGPQWQSLFDFFVYDANKPAFFTSTAPFMDTRGNDNVEFLVPGYYTRGSIATIKNSLAKSMDKEPKCLYIGDSPYDDFVFTEIDYIALVEEGKAEGIFKGCHPSAEFITSSFWGSYLYEGDKPTIFGHISLQGTACAPDLDYFAEKSIED